MKKFILVLSLIIFLSQALLSQDNIRELQILHWNDFHARNMPYEVKRTDRKTGEELVYLVGGTSNLLGYIDEYRDGKTLVLNAGDDYQGSPISSITQGFSQIELLNLYNLDAMALGNHEYDYGWRTLDSALRLANFEYLSANVYYEDEGRLAGKPWVIKNINDIKIGIIGVNAPDLLSLTLPDNMKGVVVLDTDSAIAAAVSDLKSEKVNLIILVSHSGFDVEKKYAEKFHADIDIIVGGHSHTPLFRPEIVNGTYIVQAGAHGRYLGRIDLKVDVDKDTIVSFFSELIETKMDSLIYNEQVQAHVEAMLEEIKPMMEEVIGTLETDWERSYTSESNIGQWQADAVRKRTGTNITFLNAGGIRKNLMAGDIKVVDIWEINPFGNNIVRFNVTGKTLRQMLENNLTISLNEIKNAGSSDMLIVSGIEIEYNSDNFENAEDVVTSIKVNGEEIYADGEYSISTNNYMAAQFRKYFGEIDQDIIITDTRIIDRDLIMDEVRDQKVINSKPETRIKDISKK